MVIEQRNPKSKGTASRLRYEKYKSAKCLRDIKKMGGTWQDITWDFSRGYIDFGPTAASSAAVVELVEAPRRDRYLIRQRRMLPVTEMSKFATRLVRCRTKKVCSKTM